jgi:hypothetical protein
LSETKFARGEFAIEATNARADRHAGTGEASLRLAVTPGQAAAAIGCSRDFFDEHIAPELRWVRRGRLKFVAIAELESWLQRSAALTL